MGTRALEHGRQPLGLIMELLLGRGAPRTPGATGRTHRGAKSLGECPKRLAIPDGPSLGHASERARGETRGGHGAGGGLRHIARGFLDALHAAVAAPVVVGTSTSLLERPVDICGKAVAVSPPTALTIDTRIGMADGAQAL